MRSRIPEHVTHRLLIEKIYDAIDGIERLGRLNKFIAVSLLVVSLLASVVGGFVAATVITIQYQRQPQVIMHGTIPQMAPRKRVPTIPTA